MNLKNCQGCRDNFYNGRNGLGVKTCWSFDKKQKLEWRVGPIGHWENPPYTNKKKKRIPPCWYGDGGSNRVHWVKPETLSSDGYWRH